MAAVCWAGSLAYVIASYLSDLDGPGWARLFDVLVALAITATICRAVKRNVLDPRIAYRLGWDARGRHDGYAPAEVIGMEERRRA